MPGFSRVSPAAPARVAVFVAGNGTNLQALIDAQRAGKLRSGELCLVFSTNPDAPALHRAADAGIPTRVITAVEAPDEERFDALLLETLARYNIDLIVLAGYLRILSEEFLTAFRGKIINIHPSLIPSFCGKGMYGLRVHAAALARGVRVTGATVHYVNEIPDGGEIILQKATRVLPGDTPQTLQRRVLEKCEWSILPRATEQVCAQILRARRLARPAPTAKP